MICPLRFGKQLHEGGEECVEQCAWLSCVVVDGKPHYVCAIATTALHDNNNITAIVNERNDA